MLMVRARIRSFLGQHQTTPLDGGHPLCQRAQAPTRVEATMAGFEAAPRDTLSPQCGTCRFKAPACTALRHLAGEGPARG